MKWYQYFFSLLWILKVGTNKIASGGHYCTLTYTANIQWCLSFNIFSVSGAFMLSGYFLLLLWSGRQLGLENCGKGRIEPAYESPWKWDTRVLAWWGRRAQVIEGILLEIAEVVSLKHKKGEVTTRRPELRKNSERWRKRS